MLVRRLKMGVAAIKTDFGKEINPHADYANLLAKKLHIVVQNELYEKLITFIFVNSGGNMLVNQSI